MTPVDYFAWFRWAYRPRSRPEPPDAWKHVGVDGDTKVSVFEEFNKDGVIWCQIYQPAGYADDPEDAKRYKEWWVPEAFLSNSKPGIVPDDEAPALEEVVRAIADAARKALLYLRGA